MRMKKGFLSFFLNFHGYCGRESGLNITENDPTMVNYPAAVLWEEMPQRRSQENGKTNRTATVTQITFDYNKGMQKRISAEHVKPYEPLAQQYCTKLQSYQNSSIVLRRPQRKRASLKHG